MSQRATVVVMCDLCQKKIDGARDCIAFTAAGDGNLVAEVFSLDMQGEYATETLHVCRDCCICIDSMILAARFVHRTPESP